MAIKLTPRIYGQNLKWNILPKNVIDTVSMSVTDNTKTEVEIDSREITQGYVGSSFVSLPMSDSNRAITNYSIGFTDRKTSLWHSLMATYAIYVSMLSGEYDIDLESPITGVPQVSFDIEGETTYIERGSPSVDTIHNNKIANLSEYIEQNKYGSESITDKKSRDSMNRGDLNEGLILDYNQGWVPNYAWVTKTTGSVPTGMSVAEYLQSIYRPAEENVLTIWNNDHSNDWLPPYDNWIQTGGTSDSIRQGPRRWYLGNTSENRNKFVPINDNKVPIICTATKITDYKVRVKYSIPVRYVYAAAAKAVGSFIHTTEQGRDSYAFKDVISKIIITVKATNLNEETEDVVVSRVNDNSLTSDAVNNNVFAFETNPFITKNTYMQTSSLNKWTINMPQYILNKYKDGKHIVECTVPMWWMMQNNVSINTQINIQLQDGTMLSRNGTTCIFEVKTIEKIFKDNAFSCNLRLLET